MKLHVSVYPSFPLNRIKNHAGKIDESFPAYFYASADGLQAPLGQVQIVEVQYAEGVLIVRLPGLILAAEMEDRRILHDPVQVVLAAAADEVLGIIPHIVVPEDVLYRLGLLAVEHVEHVLVRQDQLLFVVADALEHILRRYQLSGGGQVDEHDAGVEILVRRVQPHLVDLVGHFGQSRVGSRRKGFAVEVQFPQGAQGVDDEHIRVQVQYPVCFLGQNQRGEQAVIHLLRVSLAGGGTGKEGRVHNDGLQFPAEAGAEARQLPELSSGDGAVKQVHRYVLLIRIHVKEGTQHDLAGQQVIFIQSQ